MVVLRLTSNNLLFIFRNLLQEQKSSEPAPASKSNVPSKGAPAASKAGGTSSAGPVTEEEIRAVLMQKTPVTTQDLVAKFKARLRSPEVCSCNVLQVIQLFFSKQYSQKPCKFIMTLVVIAEILCT